MATARPRATAWTYVLDEEAAVAASASPAGGEEDSSDDDSLGLSSPLEDHLSSPREPVASTVRSFSQVGGRAGGAGAEESMTCKGGALKEQRVSGYQQHRHVSPVRSMAVKPSSSYSGTVGASGYTGSLGGKGAAAPTAKGKENGASSSSIISSISCSNGGSREPSPRGGAAAVTAAALAQPRPSPEGEEEAALPPRFVSGRGGVAFEVISPIPVKGTLTSSSTTTTMPSGAARTAPSTVAGPAGPNVSTAAGTEPTDILRDYHISPHMAEQPTLRGSSSGSGSGSVRPDLLGSRYGGGEGVKGDGYNDDDDDRLLWLRNSMSLLGRSQLDGVSHLSDPNTARRLMDCVEALLKDRSKNQDIIEDQGAQLHRVNRQCDALRCDKSLLNAKVQAALSDIHALEGREKAVSKERRVEQRNWRLHKEELEKTVAQLEGRENQFKAAFKKKEAEYNRLRDSLQRETLKERKQKLGGAGMGIQLKFNLPPGVAKPSISSRGDAAHKSPLEGLLKDRYEHRLSALEEENDKLKGCLRQLADTFEALQEYQDDHAELGAKQEAWRAEAEAKAKEEAERRGGGGGGGGGGEEAGARLLGEMLAGEKEKNPLWNMPIDWLLRYLGEPMMKQALQMSEAVRVLLDEERAEKEEHRQEEEEEGEVEGEEAADRSSNGSSSSSSSRVPAEIKALREKLREARRLLREQLDLLHQTLFNREWREKQHNELVQRGGRALPGEEGGGLDLEVEGMGEGEGEEEDGASSLSALFDSREALRLERESLARERAALMEGYQSHALPPQSPGPQGSCLTPPSSSRRSSLRDVNMSLPDASPCTARMLADLGISGMRVGASAGDEEA